MRELIEEVSRLASDERDLQGLTRPLLDLIQRITNLQSTYLTEIRSDESVQKVLFARNVGDGFQIPEGLEVPWDETVCKRALERGISCTDEASVVFADSAGVRELGIQTYISVPVKTPDDRLFGTLCGASSDKLQVSASALEIMTLFARLIADQIAREQALTMQASRAHLAEERLQRRARFLAEANHMLKTPLTIIAGWAELLHHKRDALSEDRVTAGLALIKEKTDELRERIDEMLEEARTEVLAMEVPLQPVDVAEIVRDTAKQFDSSERHPVIYQGPGHADGLAAKELLDQVLGHLIENAIKYSPDGGPITLRVVNDDASVRIDVEDRGVGLPHAFDPFEPFHRGPTETTKGIGLGLHIVKSLVDVMGGEVEAKKNPERGATFSVWLRAA